MHGRLKVKTTAEKEAEKKKEREKKKEIYQKCMNKIRGMFMSGDRSVDLLNLITKVLENIPEFGTLWNWRRIVLLEIFKECEEKKIAEENKVATETVEKESEAVEKERETVEKERETVEKVSGTLEKGSETGEKESETAEKDSETVEKESETVEKESETGNSPNKADMIISEKLFVARCLEVNPKAYSLWSHRRWLVEQDPSGTFIVP